MGGSPYGPYGGAPSYDTPNFDPYADRTSEIPVTATIKEIYPRVMAEDPDTIDEAAGGWTAYATLLATTSSDLDKHYGDLKPQWSSDAADVFYAWVDNAKASLSDWHDMATGNAKALTTLASTMRQLQSHMLSLWNDFDSKIAAAETEEHKSQALWDSPKRWWEGLKEGWTGKTLLDPIVEEYTNKTKSEVLEPLNTAFSDAFAAVNPGQKFTGPTNAQKPTPQQIAAAFGLGGAPPGSPPGSPGAPPGAPPAPSPPAPPGAPPAPPGAPPPLPNPPPPPAPLPNAMPGAPSPPGARPPSAMPQALGQPPAPLGTPPAGLIPPAALGATPAALGAMPAALAGGPGAAPGEAPAGLGESPAGLGGLGPSSLGRRDAPEMPRGLQGRGTGAAPEGMGEPPPGSGMRTPPPSLPGRGAGGRGTPQASRPGAPHGEMPEAPPPGRRMPALPGRNSRKPGPFDEADSMRPSAPGDDIPPNPGRFGTPRSLQGIRNTEPPTQRPGSAETEEMPLRRLPTLDGRLGPATELAEEDMESTLSALRQGLTGRGMPRGGVPGEPEAAERRPAASVPRRPAEETRDKRESAMEEASRIDFLGDSELFTAEQSAPAVIERPAEPKPDAQPDPTVRPRPTDPSVT
jgi:hypothetical protein